MSVGQRNKKPRVPQHSFAQRTAIIEKFDEGDT